MKKLIFIAVLTAGSFAGNLSAQNFGVQVGGNLASTKLEYKLPGGTISQDTKSKLGFLIGAVAEFPFTSSISFRPELNFIQKGYKFDLTESGSTYTQDATLNYIELPLNFIYNAPAGKGTFFVGAGPNFSFGLSGKIKTTETGEPNENSDIKFDGKENATSTDNNYHLKGFDLGGNLLAGYKLANGLSFNIGYTVGFLDISPDKEATHKNSGGLTFKLGYMFGGTGSKD